MGRSVEAGHSRISIVHLSRETLNALLGPAEAQYAQELVLTLRGDGDTVNLACGSSVVDESSDDDYFGAGTVEARFLHNDLLGETGYRIQVDADSSSFATEDSFEERDADDTDGFDLVSGSGISRTDTVRVMAHVGHAPGHGATPIAGDVVSNDCTVTLIIPAH